AKKRRLGPHVPAHLAQREPVGARIERDPAHVLDEREILVVDGYRHRLLVGKGARLFLLRVGGGAEHGEGGRYGGRAWSYRSHADFSVLEVCVARLYKNPAAPGLPIVTRC